MSRGRQRFKSTGPTVSHFGPVLFALRLFQLPIDPHLNPPDGKQVKPGFGLAGHHLVANAKLPFPDTRSDCLHRIFDALVNHTAARIDALPRTFEERT